METMILVNLFSQNSTVSFSSGSSETHFPSDAYLVAFSATTPKILTGSGSESWRKSSPKSYTKCVAETRTHGGISFGMAFGVGKVPRVSPAQNSCRKDHAETQARIQVSCWNAGQNTGPVHSRPPRGWLMHGWEPEFLGNA